MRKDIIKLSFAQWNRLGFSVKKGSEGIKTYPYGSTGHYYTFTEDQVWRSDEQDSEETLSEMAMGYPDKW